MKKIFAIAFIALSFGCSESRTHPSAVVSNADSNPWEKFPAEASNVHAMDDMEKCHDLRTVFNSPAFLNQYSEKLATITGATFDSLCNPTINTTINVYTSSFDADGAKRGIIQDGSVCSMFTSNELPSTATQVSYSYRNLKGVRFPTVTISKQDCGL
jgi:hypothetical protein